MNVRRVSPVIAVAVIAVFAVCAQPRAAASDPGQSTDKGIGPIKELKLGPVDEKLAATGKEIFDTHCTACHALKENMTGPALGGVLKERTPEFVMNMILNTAEMVAKDPVVKKLVDRFGMSMPAPGLSEEQARAVVEYLRTTSK
jgi:cytochrome c